MFFANRQDAGKRLAEKLDFLRGRQDVVVLALPRGGVPVGYEVAKALGAPLDVFIVRKVGVPGHEELAMGAIASGGVVIKNEDVIWQLSIDAGTFERAAENERDELTRREQLYRAGKPPADVRDRVCVVVDDGIATGASMQAAVEALRMMAPKQVIVAVPVASPAVYDQFRGLADRVVSVIVPRDFIAVGAWYQDFSQTTDEEVQYILNSATGFGSFPWRPDADLPPAFRG